MYIFSKKKVRWNITIVHQLQSHRILALHGRYFVALSLEEGQHLRAAIHRLSLDQASVFFHHADPMLN